MSKYEETLKKIHAIQSVNKSLEKCKLLCEVVEPGKTDFVPKEGDLLVCPFPIKPKERKIITGENHEPKLEDFLGVHPWMAIVMESDCKGVAVGDIVTLNPKLLAQQSQTVIIKSAVAVVISHYVITGTITNI